jgi:hypothetical protein
VVSFESHARWLLVACFASTNSFSSGEEGGLTRSSDVPPKRGLNEYAVNFCERSQADVESTRFEPGPYTMYENFESTGGVIRWYLEMVQRT